MKYCIHLIVKKIHSENQSEISENQSRIIPKGVKVRLKYVKFTLN